MKYNSLKAVLLLACYDVVSAHYNFARLLVNGTISEDFQYVRKPTTPLIPIYLNDKVDPIIRCGWANSTAGVGVQTLTVPAGTTVGFGIEAKSEYAKWGIYHPGPALGYMSAAPSGDLASYKGDGDWFKIGEYGTVNSKQWFFRGSRTNDPAFMNYTIPKTTPPGKYLIRVEQIFAELAGWGRAEFFVSCAHIEVTGAGGGQPGPLVKFPGAYDPYSPNLAFLSKYLTGPGMNLTDYVMPGPAVWTG